MKPPTGKEVVVWSCIATFAFELMTIILRFGFDLEWGSETASTVGVLTCGIRVHHGYVGLLVVIVSLLALKSWPVTSRWALVVGAALVGSDLVHHFAVLWLIVGSPEFDLMY